jgi:hypothetical protein
MHSSRNVQAVEQNREILQACEYDIVSLEQGLNHVIG